jgi:hypothetical protein
MNIEQLAQAILATLVPMLPYLLKGIKLGGQKAAEVLGEKGGEEVANQAQKAWKSISKQKGDSADKVKTAARQLAKQPHDADWQAVFKNGLAQMLKDDPALAGELASVLKLQFGEQVLQAENSQRLEVNQEMAGGGRQVSVVKKSRDIQVNQRKS